MIRLARMGDVLRQTFASATMAIDGQVTQHMNANQNASLLVNQTVIVLPQTHAPVCPDTRKPMARNAPPFVMNRALMGAVTGLMSANVMRVIV